MESLALGLAFVPLVNLVSTPLLLSILFDKFIFCLLVPGGASSSRKAARDMFKEGTKMYSQKNKVEDEKIKVMHEGGGSFIYF